MRLLKPTWMHHDGNPIFSIDIHPDDTRVVTGGAGNDTVGRVVIWNMSAVTSEEEDLNVPKLLCQLDHHNACVNCVRWSTSGKYLCSGGDDRVIIVWQLASRYIPTANSSSSVVNSAFGKTNLEQWKPLSMLRSHTGDILDLAWSPGDKYLASASVDNTVIVWDATNFPQIVTIIKDHNSMVKGVTWDPVGKYLASQSDDKTLRIWRVPTWELEQCLQDPFVECGGTTHVLRLDWSPDGSYLVSAHAMNGGGPTAQIIERTEWKTDKDFVGHRKAIVCVKFNRNIMHSGFTRVKQCVVAIGSRDRSVSIWSTALKRPLVVIKDLFSNSVLDMSWSSCGTVMMACSSDGSVSVSIFSSEEIGKPLSPEEKANFYYKLYGKTTTEEDSSVAIVQNIDVLLAKRNTQSTSNSNQVRNTSPSEIRSKPELPPQPPKGPTDKQIETRTADGRRRITPKFILPPSDTGQREVIVKSESTVFMQGKGKEDGTSNSQKTVQDLRKSMVSSIDDVKGFADPSVNTKSNIKDNHTNSIASSTGEANNNINNNVEQMEVDECNGETTKTMVNGNDHAYLNSSKKAEEVKTDESSKPTNLSDKENIVNGESLSTSVQTFPAVVSKDKEVSSSKNKSEIVVNGKLPETVSVRELSTATISKPDESGSSNHATSKKDVLSSQTQSTSGVNMIAVRKKNKNNSDETVKIKKVKLVTPGTISEGDLSKAAQPSVLVPSISGSSLVLPPQRSIGTIGNTSPSKPESSKSHHHRLPPLKIQSVLNIQVNAKADCNYSLQVTNYHKRPDGTCHQVICAHSSSSFNGLNWTICTDAPICGAFGDVFRIVLLCENLTMHVLDLKGRYALPPFILSGYPSKFVLNGPHLAVITTKATIQVWDIHLKRTVLKSESLLSLFHQCDSEKERSIDVSRVTVNTDGFPTIVLSNGKSFSYNNDMNAWMLISDPRGLVSSPLTLNATDQPLSSRLMLFGSNGRLRTKPEPAIISHIKVKLSLSMHNKSPDGVSQWMIALAKSLASHGLVKELRQLCEDLLGPTHSSSRITSSWLPTIVGKVNKRKLLRQILTLLLEDLKFQDFYSEYDELLKEVEDHYPIDEPAVAVISTLPSQPQT